MLQPTVNASITVRDSKDARFIVSVVIVHSPFMCAWKLRALPTLVGGQHRRTVGRGVDVDTQDEDGVEAKDIAVA
jgi:hypothetical protein